MSTTVDLVDLHKTYPAADEASVSGLNLAIERGALMALLGPSGCGKTTTLKMIAGLIDPTAGDVRFEGESVVGIPSERRSVAMVFQKPLLFPHMTIGENVGFGLKMRRMKRAQIQERVREMLALVRLEGYEQRRPGELSGGQEQRVSLARSLVNEPEVLLLDEPLSQLDANLRLEMRDLIRRIQNQLGVTTIFVTHDQDEAVMLADRIALMFDGKVEQEDEPRNFYERPQTLRVARFFGTLNLVPGVVDGRVFVSDLGRFELQGHLAGGAATLAIRQEQIEVGPGENQLRATVERTMYLGTVLRVWASVNGTELQFIADPRDHFKPGENVDLHIPAEHLWIVPGESPAGNGQVGA
jgi:ABC-type Fe3+/spermidine/putrescine transport system ATPase subunit